MSQLHSDIARMQKMFTSILKYASRNNIPIPQVISEDLYKLSRGSYSCSCSGSLDDDGSGSIGVDELEDPLIALGLVDNR